jgi:hypothetical protein
MYKVNSCSINERIIRDTEKKDTSLVEEVNEYYG